MNINSDITPFLVDINALVVAFIVGITIPWLTELVTHSTAPMWLRSTLNFGLSALVGTLTTLTFSEYHSYSNYLIAIVFTWVATMRAHYAGMANHVMLATANFGLGARINPKYDNDSSFSGKRLINTRDEDSNPQT